MCENFFQDSNLSESGQKYPRMPKISPGVFPVSSINSVHINIYIHTSEHTLARSLHDVSRANNNREAVVVCFRMAFHASAMRIFSNYLVYYYSNSYKLIDIL